MTKDSKFETDMIRKLDVISIFLLRQKGLGQKEIAKILGVGDNRIQEIFGDKYTKIQPEKNQIPIKRNQRIRVWRKMQNDQNKQMLNVLKSIDTKLSILISLQKSSVKPSTLGKEEISILKLCNNKNSVEDMTKVTKKTRNNVEVTLNHLKKKGLIRSAKINKKMVYVKIWNDYKKGKIR